MHGWRGKIGQIVPAAGSPTTDGELRRLLPEGVTLINTLVPTQEITKEELSTKYNENIENAAKLLAMTEVDLIVQGGTPVAQYVSGFEGAIEKRIEEVAHIPAVTTVTCVVNALKKMGIKKLAIGAPYLKQVTADLATLLEKRGFNVSSTKTLDIKRNIDVTHLPNDAAYKVGKEAFLAAPDCDGLLVTCGAMPMLDIIEKLEIDIKKPVVATYTAIAWESLTRLGVRESIPGYGSLMRSF